ncbi:oxygen-independent coproporphyrinogen-3 oxidase [Arachidicoccus rhizosphaerae]|uniref:Heme chaperone HemW n=2 Tax=Arachidicoccus rhizosphaerae TaxID=551991 RepID=A0A1H3W0T8_9BACT|nr:oxygen-independent coproporphyrinogen-3 oxidase [Arachidicoccus rhizosphaerae]
MVDSILLEARYRKDFFQQAPADTLILKTPPTISTIYFGGGTPSILPGDWIIQLIQTIKDLYPVEPAAEITLEANPDDITPNALEQWQTAGVNRLSIGVQSFIQEDLKWMNRAHTTSQAGNSVILAQQAGLSNISLDLIYGTPYLTDSLWLDNLKKANDLGVDHLSAYALTVEPRTALFKLIERGKIPPVDPEKQSRHFDLLMDWAGQNGFEHYEISNLSRPGHKSRHNSSYWQGLPYLGLGPSAHSYDGDVTRSWNIESNPLYIKILKQGNLALTEEKLSLENSINEMIMIQLRMLTGLDLLSFEQRFGKAAKDKLLELAEPAITSGQVICLQDHLRLTRKGKHFADHIAMELFV